jgi:UDP-N-acetylglucosamine diphosphorylase / glucose-1-phosphate thymidylyltransferase / UDP-N-acetylgalactosamine diphosphorylase / glucosamine-1-phosphate N-acetyltransferase / galactosamine-1-phosphate N-acetyltransferase
MSTIIFTEDGCNRENLYPFALTRRIEGIRLGILTLREKWERLLRLPSASQWQGHYLDGDGSYLLLRANLLPDAALVRQVKQLRPGSCLIDGSNRVLALAFTAGQVGKGGKIKVAQTIGAAEPPRLLEYAWQLFQFNDWAIRQDFALLTRGRTGKKLHGKIRCANPKAIFVEPGAVVAPCSLNASTGPIYIGKNAVVMEGCLVRGPLALCENAVLKMGAQVYGATTLGPHCVGGGEIKNSLLMGYSNKAHHGYLGDSVIGEWCNLGAGTTNSNLKNNAGPVNYSMGKQKGSPGNKGGLLMGDHSKAAINTAFNTGTVVGVCCNVFGNGLTPTHIPSFSWGTEGGNRYDFEKAVADIGNWMALKGASLDKTAQKQLKHIFDHH